MQDEYESLKYVLRGMGGSPTAEEVSKAMASLGCPVENVEELLDRAVREAPDEFLKTLDCSVHRYQSKTRARILIGNP